MQIFISIIIACLMLNVHAHANTMLETFDMSKEKITEILLSRNAKPETVNEFINLTENCEIARFAPATSVTIQQDFDKAVEIISNLEKQI